MAVLIIYSEAAWMEEKMTEAALKKTREVAVVMIVAVMRHLTNFRVIEKAAPLLKQKILKKILLSSHLQN